MSTILNSMLSSLASTPVPSLTSLASTKYEPLLDGGCCVDSDDDLELVLDDENRKPETESKTKNKASSSSPQLHRDCALATSLPVSVVNLTDPGITLEWAKNALSIHKFEKFKNFEFENFELASSATVSNSSATSLESNISVVSSEFACVSELPLSEFGESVIDRSAEYEGSSGAAVSPLASALPLSSANSVEVFRNFGEKKEEKKEEEDQNLNSKENQKEDQVAEKRRRTPSSITHELNYNTVTYAKLKNVSA